MLLLVDEFSALRLGNAAALFEGLRSFNAGVVLAAQSVEGLHDDEAERTRLLNSASTLIAHRLADPDPVVLRAGTIRRAERSHQLDPTGATGMGSLRLQDTYRIDPNDLRSLPAGVAWVVTGGRAAKVAVATARGGRAPLSHPTRTGGSCGDPEVGSPRRGRRNDTVVGPGGPALERTSGAAEGVEDIEAERPIPVTGGADVVVAEEDGLADTVGEVIPMGSLDAPPLTEEPAPPARSPYAQGL